ECPAAAAHPWRRAGGSSRACAVATRVARPGRAVDAPAETALPPRAAAGRSRLAGVEHWRVAGARALANQPKLVLADEPTGNLDEHTADVVFAEFLTLVRGEGGAALVVTHNERIAAKMDRVVRLHEGRLE